MNLPLEIALIGTVFYLLVFAVMLRYAALHYTRVPGGKWTTWEKAPSQTPEYQEEERAA